LAMLGGELSQDALLQLQNVERAPAVTIATELGNITSRFESARKLMGYRPTGAMESVAH
jgi:hypothetical protein